IGAMRVADTLLVNPLFDGLNLAAKEGPLVSRRDAVLVLSENAGAYEELAEGALGVNPFDVGETADTLERAFEMPADERAERSEILLRAVCRTTPDSWIREQLGATAP